MTTTIPAPCAIPDRGRASVPLRPTTGVCPSWLLPRSEDGWQEYGPCPMTGEDRCPSDPKQQAKCPQC